LYLIKKEIDSWPVSLLALQGFSRFDFIELETGEATRLILESSLPLCEYKTILQVISYVIVIWIWI